SFWHERVEPTDGARQQVSGVVGEAGSCGIAYFLVVLWFSRCRFGSQVSVKVDHLRGDPGIHEVVDREMSVASSLCYQLRRSGYFRPGQTDKLRDASQFGLRILEEQIVMSNKAVVLVCGVEQAAVVDLPQTQTK